MQRDAMRYDAVQWYAVRWKAMRCSAKDYDKITYNTAKLYDMLYEAQEKQCCDTQRSTTQHSAIIYRTTRHRTLEDRTTIHIFTKHFSLLTLSHSLTNTPSELLHE